MSGVERTTPTTVAPTPPSSESSFWDAFRAESVDRDAPRQSRAAWLRWLFPSIWLVFLAAPVGRLAERGGVWGGLGIALIVVFGVCYVLAIPAGWGGDRRRFHVLFGVMVAVTLAVTPIAHETTFSLFVYIAALLVAGFRRWAVLGVVGLTVVGVVVPVVVGWETWNRDELANAITLPLVAVAMYGFFSMVDANRELAAARTEVVRLAAENERTRIARDLHDLLGHSLTTITVKAGLARKLAERDGSVDAAKELAEVEAVARRSLREVRAAVSGYNEVTLAGELATSRAVLRAANIGADLPGAVDAVDATRSELFGWVVREAVTNVVRHARARRCRIELGANWIEVTDDGSALDHLAPVAPGPGRGIAGLRERVETAGGRLECGTTGHGWRIRVDVPT